MKDREEIVSAFKQCGLPGACLKCKYGAEREGCYAALRHDVLELLKEQEPKPVRPINVRWEMGIRGGTCPKCLNWVQRTYKYCPFCGKAVQWDET